MLDWRKQDAGDKLQVKYTIERILGANDQVLDDGLPGCYTDELFNQKSEAVYQHFYDSYYGEGKSIYTEN